MTAVVAMVAVLLGVAVAPASASDYFPDYVSIKASGNYSAEVVFPDRGGYSSTVVAPGGTWTKKMSNLNYTETIEFYGYYSSGQTFLILRLQRNLHSRGILLGLGGTTARPVVQG
ncbi:hypothetical protein [Actinoplanes sp. L3-i22]|uniref:hypothetical protein n=1 Tax=Actinoplanes sp. L3-i22 TaxID=2836373 RepID=UPI001C75399E|nr:hypothetical protein [Actinoplanes sp. L3-i22]BCY07250.1 hypothetical protein L3i22_023380 [Actinoplanes sp. L3-i22]